MNHIYLPPPRVLLRWLDKSKKRWGREGIFLFIKIFSLNKIFLDLKFRFFGNSYQLLALFNPDRREQEASSKWQIAKKLTPPHSLLPPTKSILSLYRQRLFWRRHDQFRYTQRYHSDIQQSYHIR